MQSRESETRIYDKCADMLKDSHPQMWHLRETIPGCVFKVVSKDPKLTNCFWNFYRLHPREE